MTVPDLLWIVLILWSWSLINCKIWLKHVILLPGREGDHFVHLQCNVTVEEIYIYMSNILICMGSDLIIMIVLSYEILYTVFPWLLPAGPSQRGVACETIHVWIQLAYCVHNAHITVYDTTTWSWVNLLSEPLRHCGTASSCISTEYHHTTG